MFWNEKGVEIINERTHVNGIKRFYKHVTARPRWPITKCALTQTWMRHLWSVQMDSSHEMLTHLRESSYNSRAPYSKCLLAVCASSSTEATFTYFYFLCEGFLVIVEYLHKMVSFDLNLSWQLFSSRLWNILFFWNHYLHSASSPLRAAKYAGKQKKKKGNRLKKMLHQYQLPCRSVKVGVRFDFHLKKWNRTRKTQFASFAYELRFFARGCHFMHSDSHIQVCSLKNERVAVSGSTRQTVLGDGPVILDTVYRQSRCTPASTSHTATYIIYCQVQQPPRDAGTEEVCSFGKRVRATSFFSPEEFLEGRREVKNQRAICRSCLVGAKRAGQENIMTRGECFVASLAQL